MRYEIYYIRWFHIMEPAGLRDISTMEYLKSVDAEELNAVMKRLYGVYVQLWIKPVAEEGE